MLRTLKSLREDRGGFSVLEAVVSLVILSMGLLGFASVIPAMKGDLVRSDQRTRALYLTQETVEWLHGLPYDDDELTEGLHQDAAFDVEGFERSWTIENDQPLPNVKRVTVNIDRDGSESESASIVFLHAEAGR